MNLKTTIINIEKILKVINNNDELKIYNDISFLEPIHYNLITSFHKNNQHLKIKKNISFSKKTEPFLKRVGLHGHLGLNNFSFWNGTNDNLIEITNIKNGKDAEKIGNKFIETLKINLIKNNFNTSDNELIDNIGYSIGELLNNVIDHSEDYSSNFSSGHYFSNENIVQFAVVDSGKGIKNDLENTLNDITSHKQAIKQALIKGNSGKIKDGISIIQNPYGKKENAGVGLTAVNNIVIKNGGDIIIGTGNYIYVYDSNENNFYYKKIDFWKGTFIMFNLYTKKSNIYDYNTILNNLMDIDGNIDIIDNIKFF